MRRTLVGCFFRHKRQNCIFVDPRIPWIAPGKADMAKRRISGKKLLEDIRSGMDDAGLMEKYKLSSKGILMLMSKLVTLGVLTPEELASRRSLAKTLYFPTFKCPACGEIHYTKSEFCPSCGALMTQLNK